MARPARLHFSDEDADGRPVSPRLRRMPATLPAGSSR
jgi:hypothetical protein